MLADTTSDPPPPDPAEKVQITNTVTSEDTPDVKDENSVDNQLETIAATPEETQESIVAISKPDEPMDVDQSDGSGKGHEGDESMDELDCIPRDPVPAPVGRMSELRIEEKTSHRLAKRVVPSAGQEISSLTLDVYKEQNQATPSGSEPLVTKFKPEAEAVKPVPKKADRPPDHVILKSQK